MHAAAIQRHTVGLRAIRYYLGLFVPTLVNASNPVSLIQDAIAILIH